MSGALSKTEIVRWYERAKRSIEFRLEGKHKLRCKINDECAAAYLASIERHFKRLKAQFNAQLRGEGNGQNTSVPIRKGPPAATSAQQSLF